MARSKLGRVTHNFLSRAEQTRDFLLTALRDNVLFCP